MDAREAVRLGASGKGHPEMMAAIAGGAPWTRNSAVERPANSE